MKKLSLVISAYNEEKNIKDCIKSADWADEIVVIDNSSTDKTNLIAKKYTPKVFKRENYQMLNINKNYGFEKTSGDWILNLDADERVSPELKKEIQNLLKKEKIEFDGFEIPRKNIIFGKWIQHGIWWPDCQIRLFKKEKGKFDCLHVHEKINLKGKLGRLANPLIHYNYQTIDQYIFKFTRIYTDNQAENFIRSGKKIHWYDAIRMPVNEFLATFLSRSIYKDGLHGLVLSILQSFCEFVVFCKVWERQKFWEYDSKNFLNEVNIEVNKSYKDYKFWTKSATLKKFAQKVAGRKLWESLREAKEKIKIGYR